MMTHHEYGIVYGILVVLKISFMKDTIHIIHMACCCRASAAIVVDSNEHILKQHPIYLKNYYVVTVFLIYFIRVTVYYLGM